MSDSSRSQPTVSTLPLRKLTLSNNLSLVLKIASTCWLVSVSGGGALVLLDYIPLRKSSRIYGWAWVLCRRKDYFWWKHQTKPNSKFQQNRVLHPSVDEFFHFPCGMSEKRPERTAKPSAKLQTVRAGGDTQDCVDRRPVTTIEAPQLQHREPPA